MMATKTDATEESIFWPYTAPDYEFERTLPWLYGDRHYLQGSHEDFIDLFLHNEYEGENTNKSDPTELVEIAKLALSKGELDIAEKCLVKAMHTVMFDTSYKRSPEPYRYLADVLAKKAEDKQSTLLQRQRFLLQAAALYNFVQNYLKTEDVEDELAKTLQKSVCRRLIDIQDDMVLLVGGNPLHCKFDSELKRNQLKSLRDDVKKSLESVECSYISSKNQGSLNDCGVRQMLEDQTAEIKRLSETISKFMKQFLASIINECLEILGTPPCEYEVIVLGSLARNEMTPYSDFEWAILTSSEEEECKVFFRNLTNLVHLQVINVGETILPSMDIEAINGGWFYDDITARGVSFDGFLPQACKTPLGNMQEFELIHTPEKMADFQNNNWYEKNWSLADTLLTISPLQPNKHALVDTYRNEMAKILSSPCDLECCEHDALCGTWPTRGSCRGLRTLQDDLSRYGDVMTGSNDLDDGKFYDVKKEIYRLTDRVFAALAKCYEVDASGTFAILDELYKKKIITLEARDNFARASAIAIKLRISTYIKAEKQGEQLVTSSNVETGKLTSVYHMPNDEELFHFFFIAIPLYEEVQKITAKIPPSLTHCSFFDDSDVTMGHVYCRLLNYGEAAKCYERVLQHDADTLSVEIRRIRIVLFVARNKEQNAKIQESLDTVLCKISQCSSTSPQNVDQVILENTPFVNNLDAEECRQLVEVLLFASLYFDCHKYFLWAEKILAQCLAEKTKPNDRKELLMMKFAFMIFYIKHFYESLVHEDTIDAITCDLTSLIDEEGVNTKSIVWLNKLGEFLFIQGKYDQAYRCFQRALSMEHLLYGNKPNVNMMTSLNFLGMTSMYLYMYEESKFYFELLLQLFDSYGGPTARLIVKNAYLQLALLSVAMGYSVNETVYYMEKGLKVITGIRNDTELILDCVLYCQLATTLYPNHNPEQAWKYISDGKACLKNIVRVQARVTLTCMIAIFLAKIGKTNDGIVLLKAEIQKLKSHPHLEDKAFCMMNLGEIYEKQGLASDAEHYYKQALDILVAMEKSKHIFKILECLVGISKTNMMDNRESEAKIFLDQAFNLAMKMTASKNKCSFLDQIGELFRSLSDVVSARQCFDEAIRTCRESNIAKKVPITEFKLHVKLGEMAMDDSVNHENAIPLEQRLQAQRSHYDRAAEVLRKHVVTGQVDSTTVLLFLSLALSFTLVDFDEKIRLLLEALEISEVVYGRNEPNEMVTKILRQLSDTYWMTGNKQATTKYTERLLRMEMELHLSNPYHEHISHNLTNLSLCFLESAGGVDTIQRAYEFFLLAQNDTVPSVSADKAATARCFTSLGVLFYALGDLEKAETLNEMASQVFGEICESAEGEKLMCKTTCDIMKKILITLQITQKVLPSHKNELLTSIKEVRNEDLSKQVMILSHKIRFDINNAWRRRSHAIATQGRSSDSNVLHPLPADKTIQQEVWKTERNTDKDWLEDTTTSENFSSDRENSNSSIPRSNPGSNGVKSGENESLSPQAMDVLTQSLSQISLPVNVESFPDALVNLESIKSTNKFLSGKLEEMLTKLPSIVTLFDAYEYNANVGNVKEVAKIGASLQSQMLSIHENSPFDNGKKLINEAIANKEKKNNKSLAIRHLDLAYQLPSSNWRRKSQILKLRGECYLSMGDCRTASINFAEAARFFSSETLENCDDLYEYSEVLIGLIKSEILCQNVPAAWLNSQKGIKLVSDHELKETMYVQAVQFFYLGAKCLAILSESAVNKVDELTQAWSLCQQAFSLSQKIDQSRNASDLMEELGSSSERGKLFALKCEVHLLLASVGLQLQKEDAKRILEELKEFLRNITEVVESLSPNSMLGGKPEFLKVSYRLFSWFGRTLVMCDEMELSITWLNKSLVAFFSAPLPDTLSIYEEFLPFLHALTISKSNGSHESRIPFKQAVDMCKEACVNHDNNFTNFYACLKTLVTLYMSFGRIEEALIVAESGLGISDLMLDCDTFGRMKNRSRMLLYLAQSHQLRSTNSTFDRHEELSLTEKYYRMDHGSSDNFALRKHLSYANFLCDQNRFAEADAILRESKNLGKQAACNKYLSCSYFQRTFYGPGVQKSVEVDGELMTTTENVMLSTMIRVFVGMGKIAEAVAACENLTANSVDVHESIVGKRPSCLPYLIEACHRELLSLVGDEDRKQLQNCDFPLAPPNLARLFLAMLQIKEGLLDKPFDDQSKILGEYTFAYPYYVFRSLGKMLLGRGNLDGAIKCYERCLELDLTCDQNLVATLAELYQSKAFTLGTKNQDSWKRHMDLALNLFQKLHENTAEITTFVECTFASLLCKLERYNEAIQHFQNVIGKEDGTFLTFADDDKPLLDVYLRREIESSRTITMPIKVRAFYELILIYMTLDEVEKASEVALEFENYIEPFQSTPKYTLARSMVGYAHKRIGNNEKAAEIFVSVLEIVPGHLPVTEAWESCCI